MSYYSLENWAFEQWGPIARVISKSVFALVIILLAVLVSWILVRLIRKRMDNGMGRLTVFTTLAQVVVWLVAALIICEPVFGIQPTAVATALGVGSLILSLGLSTTVSNIVAGIQLTTHHVVRPGDHIELGSYRGEIKTITWRNLTILDTNGDTEVIPNSLLNSTTLKVLNPKNRYKHLIDVEVRPLSDLVAVGEDIIASGNAALQAGGWFMEDYPVEVKFLESSAFGVRASVRIFLRDEDTTIPATDAVMRALKQKPYLSDVTNPPEQQGE